MEHGNYGKTAYINYGLIAVNFAYFFFLEAVGSTDDVYTMVRYGALFLPSILQEGEYWRLLTAMFMHFGIQHIVNNMLILFVLGDNLERALGKVKYLIFYLICGIGANGICLLINLFSEDITVSAGASGAIFGVVGGLLYVVTINRGRLEDLNTRQLVILAGFSLYAGFTTVGTNNAAHISGLAIGIVMAMILYRKPVIPDNKEGLDYER